MNAYAVIYIEEYLQSHAVLTTAELLDYVKKCTRRNVPTARELGHYLSHRADFEYIASKHLPYWRRIDLTPGAKGLVMAMWEDGAIPMHELRSAYGPAVDEATAKGLILRAESAERVDYMLTRKGVTFARELMA